jgi:hypothetical protein
MSKAARLRNALLILVNEHRREGMLPLVLGSYFMSWLPAPSLPRSGPGNDVPIKTCPMR